LLDKLSELWAIDKAASGTASLPWETVVAAYRPGLKALRQQVVNGGRWLYLCRYEDCSDADLKPALRASGP
jgi:hypothetical protein